MLSREIAPPCSNTKRANLASHVVFTQGRVSMDERDRDKRGIIVRFAPADKQVDPDLDAVRGQHKLDILSRNLPTCHHNRARRIVCFARPEANELPSREFRRCIRNCVYRSEGLFDAVGAQVQFAGNDSFFPARVRKAFVHKSEPLEKLLKRLAAARCIE